MVLHLSGSNELEKIIKIRRIFIVAAISGFLVSVYAIMQLFGLDFVTWSEPPYITGRAVASFGQPNYLACWLLIILPFSAYLFTTTKNKLAKNIWALFFVAGVGALFATGSRTALLTFIVVSILWSLWFFSKKKILSRSKILIIFFSGLVTVLVFTVFLAISNPSRFNEFSNIKKGSAYVRLELWKSGFQEVLKKPLLGYGLENQKEAYVKHYKVDTAVYSRPNAYGDRAHNLILDILLTTGVIGLLFFVYFLRWVYLNLLFAFKNNNSDLAAFLIWSLTAYLVSLLFNFSVVMTDIYFWLIVGLSLSLAGNILIVREDEEKKLELVNSVLIIGVFILFLYGSSMEVGRLKADYYFNKSLEATANSQYFTSLVFWDYIYQTHPDKVTQYFYDQNLSLRFLESLPNIQDKSSMYVVKKYLETTQKIIPASNFENNFVKAFILGALGHSRESENIFKNLTNLSSKLPKLYLAWGDTLLFNHDYANAKIKFEKTLSLLPDINNPYINAEQKIRLNAYRDQIDYRLNKTKLLLK